MRILVVGLATFGEMTGGSARYVSGLTAALTDAGHDVTTITAAGRVGPPGGGVIGLLRRGARRVLVVAPAMLAAVRRRPDVVNVHFALDGLAPTLAARVLRVPVVVTFHGPWAEEAVATGRLGRWPLSTRLRRAIERAVYRRADRCIALSEAFASVLVERYGVDRRRIRVVPGGIDVARFADVPEPGEARRRLGWPEQPTLVAVRRLVRRMGLDLAIDALARLDPSVRLAVAGDGPERAALAERAAAAGLGDRVSLLGRVDEAILPLVYAAGDVTLVPSRTLEGFGYGALEALAAGRPVVASGVGGLRDLVGGLDPAMLGEPDADALASAIRPWLPGGARVADRAAIRAYAARFAWPAIGARVVDVLEEARSVRRT